MNRLNHTTTLVVTFLVLSAIAFGQEPNPREQFQAAVAAFQKSATEETARKLAELAKQLNPPPAISDEADRHALKGAAYAEVAKVPADFKPAAAEFTQAIQLAPWVGDYHYNLALMLKSVGGVAELESALRSTELARLLARDDKERRDATALGVKVEVSLEVAKTGAAKIAAEARQAAAARQEQMQRQAWAQSLAKWMTENYGQSIVRRITYIWGTDEQARTMNWSYLQNWIGDLRTSRDSANDWARMRVMLSFRAEGENIIFSGPRHNNAMHADLIGKVTGSRWEDLIWTEVSSGMHPGRSASVRFVTSARDGKPLLRTITDTEPNGAGQHTDFEFEFR